MSTGNRFLGAVALLALAPMTVLADVGHKHGSKKMSMIDYSKVEEHAFGKATDPAAATRVIDVSMTDAMRFEPAVIKVSRGEPLRLKIRNDGKLMHELVLGSREELDQHAEMMRRFPGMEHDEPHMVHVEPGKSGDMGWTFTQKGEYYYGCLVPGHFEGGMIGKVVVE